MSVPDPIKRRQIMRRILLGVLLLFAFQNVEAEDSGLSRSYEDEILKKARGVFWAEETEYEVERPICATPLYLEIKANWDKLSARTKETLKSYTARPPFNFPEHTYDTPQGHFKIHYVVDGDSAVYQPGVDEDLDGHPDWVNTCGEVLEHVWDSEVNVLGYDRPPDDGWYPDTEDNGGDGRYDVYLLGLPRYYLGYTQQELSVPSHSTLFVSYMVLDNDYQDYGSLHSQLEWLQVTVAHEFFHAVQFGYDGTEYEVENDRPKFYWMEMCAVWMEDMVYDDVNDYVSYLPSFFNHPEWSLKTFSNDPSAPPDEIRHAYGGCVWPIFLSERFDAPILREIWEECARIPGNNAIDYPLGESAIDKAVIARGYTFEDAFREFTVWNYFTADRAITKIPNRFYSEGDLFYLPPQGIPIMVKVDTLHDEYPVNVTSIPHLPENLASNYVVFFPHPDLVGGIKIDFAGHSGEYRVSAVGYNRTHLVPFDTTLLINPATQTGTGRVCDWNSYEEVIMIPAVTTRSPNLGFIYEYSADYDSSCHGDGQLPEQDRVLQNFPNPFVIEDEADSTYFPFILRSPSRVRIDILTLSGERVKSIVAKHDPRFAIGEYLDKSLAMPWDGKNEKGEYVTSGIDLYRFRTERNTVIKKMAVIR
jgi:hypothetical protein